MPSEALRIRPLQDADCEALIALWRVCNLTVPDNDPAQDITFARGKDNSDILIGTLDDRLVASVMVGHDGHRGWLYYVAVEPGQQGRKLGRLIVEAGENWLRARHVPKAQLMIRETNTRVRGFYEAVGWKAIPRTVMQKWLR